MLLLGNEAAAQQRYEDAERYFKGALELDSCFAPAWNNRGSLMHKQARFKEAIPYYTRAIACDPDYLTPLLNRANSEISARNYDQALKSLYSYRIAGGDSIAVDILEGLAYWRAHQYEAATKSYKRLVGKANTPEFLVNVANTYIQRKQYDSASLYCQQALQLDSIFPEAINASGLIQVGQGNLLKAEQIFTSMLRRNENDAYANSNLGYLRLLQNDLAGALKYIDKSILMDAENAWAYRNKGIVLLRQERYQEALRLLLRAEQSDPLTEGLKPALAEVYYKLGASEKACAYVNAAKAQGEKVTIAGCGP